MKSRRLRGKVLAATVGLWMAHNGLAHAQPPAAPSRLEINPAKPCKIAPPSISNLPTPSPASYAKAVSCAIITSNVRVQGGSVELSGQVTDQPQREEVLRIVQGVPGVDRVNDQLQTVGQPVTPVVAMTQPVYQDPRPVMHAPPQAFTPPMPTPMQAEPNPFYREPIGVGGTNPGFASPPPMPPYAWPTAAPYNNFSRVAYPTQYPLEAFPFIGPFHPYPKVPLGWRSVTLKWEDNHWWFGRKATGYDWWRVRYW